MKTIKVKFTDFWTPFIAEESFAYSLLQTYANIEIVDNNPDLIVTGAFGDEFLQYDVPKICISPEFMTNSMQFVDVMISSSPASHPMAKQYSNIVDYDGMRQLLQGRTIPSPMQNYQKTKKTKFCNFLYANSHAYYRIKFCKQLMRYKWVDCLGLVLRNTDTIIPKSLQKNNNWTAEQLYIYKDYKFTIAFENFGARGYVCEKITQPLLAGSIPIYWGADDIADYINPKAFIHVRDFKNFADCIEYVKKIDNDDKLYQKYLNEPILLPNSKLYSMHHDALADWLREKLDIILQPDYQCVGKQSKYLWALFVYKRKCIKLLHYIKDRFL